MNSSRNHPIGIFDSGIGGIAIARKIRELLPAESILYVADTQHAPYGEKSDDYILQRSVAITDFLIAHQAKAIVVACNTATTSCIAQLRARYDIPFIGVEPGVKPAVLHSQSGVVGILATPKTLTTRSFSSLTERFSSQVKVEVMPCPDLVTQVEALGLAFNEAEPVVRKYVAPLLAKGADTLVLGCTHYSHLAPVIAAVAGPQVRIVSTEEPVAREARRRLESAGLLCDSQQAGNACFYTSGSLPLFQQQVARLWGASSAVLPLN